MRIFDPNSNPYARDLHRLRSGLERRYTSLERVALGRVIAAKLYELEPRFGHRFGQGRLFRNLVDDRPVELHVVFDDAIKAGRLHRRLRRYRTRPERQLIVLIIGDHGVAEVFNGFQGELEREGLARALDAMRGDGDAYSLPLEEVVPPRSDAAAEDYFSVRGSSGEPRGETGNDRAEGGTDRSGDNGRGSGNQRRDGGNNRGNGGNGDNDGTDGPGGTPGRGGAGELVNHPVLFAVERHVYDAILDEI